MILRRFKAENFRNIERCDINFYPGVNLLHGKNAQGKTNAIEGIYLFSRGKSFRAREDSELVKFGEEGFRVYIEYEDNDGKSSLEYASFGREKQRKKNGYKISRVNEMIGSFKSVLFYPDNLDLVKGGPEERRNFINVALSQCYPSYIKYYSDYKKALENRNCVLKFMNKGMVFDRRELDAWSVSMAEYASYIFLLREEYLAKLKTHTKRIMNEISLQNEDLELIHDSSLVTDSLDIRVIKEKYEKLLYENIDKEIAAGVTLYGPHRDDIKIKINGNEARYFASQGQQRSIVLALKLSEGEVIREMFGEYPVFLFDDVLSELDETRRNYVLSGVGQRQIIITSCDPDEFSGIEFNEIDVCRGNYVHTHR